MSGRGSHTASVCLSRENLQLSPLDELSPESTRRRRTRMATQGRQGTPRAMTCSQCRSANLQSHLVQESCVCVKRLSDRIQHPKGWAISLHVVTVFLAFSRVQNNLRPVARRILKMANPTRHRDPNRTLFTFARGPFREFPPPCVNGVALSRLRFLSPFYPALQAGLSHHGPSALPHR
jgi:hypothetical protein